MGLRSLLFLLVFGAVYLSSCNEGQNKEEKEEEKTEINGDLIENPETADESAKKNYRGLPSFEFENDEHDFGNILEGEKVSYSFKFKNSGTAPLIITNARASCGCTVPNYPKEPVEPGEEGLIDVLFNSSGKSGTFNKSVTIQANTQPAVKVLKITGRITKK